MEGPRAIADALSRGAPLDEIFLEEDQPLSGDIQTRALAAGVEVHLVGRQVTKVLTESSTPQGVVAVSRVPKTSLQDLSGDLVVVLDAVSDPGNAGTIIRTAAAAGASGVVFTSGCVDAFGPKTVRAAAGALFETTVITDVGLEETIDRARALGLRVIGTSTESTVAYHDSDLTRPVAIVAGNEAWGVPVDHLDLMDETITIPMAGSAESLNVATATSIVVFEVLRQRRLSSAGKEHGG